MTRRFVGIDVQSARPCAIAVLDAEGRQIDAAWISPGPGLDAAIRALLARHPDAVVGIDAPRMPLRTPREWYWSRRSWRPRRASDRGAGRHCEVVVKAHAIANPQWTPLRGEAPAWMRIGFRLFELVREGAAVHEVFPSASYRLLASQPEVRATLGFAAFRPGPKDMLDAIVAAVTAREFDAGRGAAVGGGDALGEIVLPRPLPDPIPGVLEWPGGRPRAPR